MPITIEVKDVQAVLPVSAAWNANLKVENSELVIYDDGPQKTLEMSNLRIATEKKDSFWSRQKVVSVNKERTLNIETKNSKIAIDEVISEQGTVNITGELSKLLFFESQRAIEGNKND